MVYASIACVCSHICDDRVAAVRGHKILDFGRRRSSQVVAADEMRREIAFCRVAARCAIHFHAVGGHVVGRRSRSGSLVVGRMEGGGWRMEDTG